MPPSTVIKLNNLRRRIIEVKKVLAVRTAITMSMSVLFSTNTIANNVLMNDIEGEIFGNLRMGYISIEDNNGTTKNSSAIGGKFGGIIRHEAGLSAGATLFTTQKLFKNENSDLFGSDNDGYTILGEAFLQADFNNTQIKVGRFGFDSPHADTDDIRMISNTFSGISISNTDIEDMTIVLAHFDKWAGFDSDISEKFTDMNGDDGVTVAGVTYEGIENVALQSWYYHGRNFANIIYLEAIYESENFSIGAQFSSQTDKTDDDSGADGDLYGITASYSLGDVTFSTAYNNVSGTVINGFGGGPYFTSSADHTVEEVLNQNAMAVGIEYSGIEGLSLSILNVAFDEGADETDYTVSWDISENMDFEIIYHHMHQDGDMVYAVFNYGF